MGSKRKSKQPSTVVKQIEALLSDALDQLSIIEKSVEKNVRELLVTAEASVAKARDFITPALAAAAPRKPVRARKHPARKGRAARRVRKK
jgi:hypothetical protein